MDASDWISNIIAALALIAAVALTVWTNRKNSATEERQRALVDAQRETYSTLAQLLADVADRRLAADAHHAPGSSQLKDHQSSVRWVMEHISKNTWLLRNLGTATAAGVRIDKPSLGGVRVDFTPVLPTDVGPGESIEIRIIPAFGHPAGYQGKVTWGEDESETVPLPRWQ